MLSLEDIIFDARIDFSSLLCGGSETNHGVCHSDFGLQPLIQDPNTVRVTTVHLKCHMISLALMLKSNNASYVCITLSW